MPRKPTKGPPIAFRLPLAEHERFKAEAFAVGDSPGEFARRIILASSGPPPKEDEQQ